MQNNLKKIRLESGLKVQKIADVLGITREQVYNLEKGKYKISADKLYKLEYLFRCSKEDIFGGVE